MEGRPRTRNLNVKRGFNLVWGGQIRPSGRCNKGIDGGERHSADLYEAFSRGRQSHHRPIDCASDYEDVSSLDFVGIDHCLVDVGQVLVEPLFFHPETSRATQSP